jgi:ABC-type branched-subunit amino acid transport system permease subunit
MAATVGSIIFVVVVVGGMGSLSGAFIASLLIGTVQTFAVAFDHSLFSVLQRAEFAAGGRPSNNSLARLTIAQVAPILPYLLLVLILIFRPGACLETARADGHVTHDLPVSGAPGSRALFALVMLAAPQLFKSGLAVTMLSQMGIAIIACLSYNMLLGQGGMLSFGHAVYTGLGAFVAIHALNRYGGGGAAGLPGAAGGWLRRHGLCRAVWLRHHAQVGHHLRHDHARPGRTGVCHVADDPGVFRWRRRCLGQPGDGPAGAGHQLWPGHPGVLPDRRLHPGVHWS